MFSETELINFNFLLFFNCLFDYDANKHYICSVKLNKYVNK